ncbi:MAG: phosphoglycolate phosphatase [Burkholderiaceae bacterium]
MSAPSRLTPVRAVLFDLDGTLIDSAPDLAGAANDMRAARGLPRLSLAHFRPMVGSGARGMVGQAFQVGPQDDGFAAMREEFLQRYETRMTQDTRLFPDVAALLDALLERGVPWGIVTNKAERFSVPLVHALGLRERAAVLVCGDTTAHPKPHPEPLFEAARRLRIEPAHCLYVGDDRRDAQAGRAAGMRTVAVTWGYLGLGDPIDAWGADHIIDAPSEVLNLLVMA